jgi:hypothetical protein
MKKIVILSLTFVFSAFSLYSCDNQEDITSANASQTVNKEPGKVNNLLSKDNITTLDAINNIGNEDYFDGSFSVGSTAQLAFTHGEDRTKVNTGLDKNGNYIFDMDGDKAVDLQIVPLKSDYSEVIYVDGDGNKISRAKVELEGTNANVTILEVYNPSSKFTQLTQKGKWRSCFQSVAGSAEGIAGSVVCAFGGPWCYAGYYSGIAVGCLFA